MVVCRAPVLGVLEGGNSRSPRLLLFNDRNRHHHPVHTGRLGCGRRLSGDERQRGVPDEGCGSSRYLLLLAEAGRGESCTFRGRARQGGGWRVPRPGRGASGSRTARHHASRGARAARPPRGTSLPRWRHPVPGLRVTRGRRPTPFARSGRCKSNGTRHLHGSVRRIRSSACRLRSPMNCLGPHFPKARR